MVSCAHKLLSPHNPTKNLFLTFFYIYPKDITYSFRKYRNICTRIYNHADFKYISIGIFQSNFHDGSVNSAETGRYFFCELKNSLQRIIASFLGTCPKKIFFRGNFSFAVL